MGIRGLVQENGWGAALVGVFAVLVIAWTGYELSQWPPDPPDGGAGDAVGVSRQQAGQEPPDTTEPTETTSLIVVGDSYAAGTGADEPSRSGFADLLGSCLELPVTVEAGAGVAYLSTSPDGAGVGDSVSSLVREAELEEGAVVIFAAGIQDRLELVGGGSEEQLRDAARRAWKVADKAGNQVVVLGPFWPAAELNDPAIRTVRDALRDEADSRGYPFVDPTGWLDGRVASDGAHPDQEGHQFIADRLAEALDEAGLASNSC